MESGSIPIAPFAIALAIASCSVPTLPPLGAALVIVDTDVPVRFVNRLRVDFYDTQHGWFDSRDIARFKDSDWPATFGVYLPESAPSRSVLVRVRAYPEGGVRDYLGERFTPREITTNATDSAIHPADRSWRLVRDGRDVTPFDEPQPFVTIDRLVRVKLEPGKSGKVKLDLRGACFGTMADLVGQRTCESDGALVPITTLEPSSGPMPAAIEKTFGASVACASNVRAGGKGIDGSPLYDDEVCIDGAGYVFGNADIRGFGPGSGVPQHVVVLSPFAIDKYEVTVARWRDAIARGFKSPKDPIAGSGQPARDLCGGTPRSTQWCTWTASKGAMESYPVNCVSWEAARAFCQFSGEDLPTEAQWEWVAQANGRTNKTVYPWGDALPTCTSSGPDTTIFARLPVCAGGIAGRSNCLAQMGCGGGMGCGVQMDTSDRAGPQRVDRLEGDIAIGSSVVGLGSNVAELVSDGFAALDSQCWASASLVDPVCADATQPALRGGSWSTYDINTRAGLRKPLDTAPTGADFTPTQTGFRCARRVAP